MHDKELGIKAMLCHIQ